MTLKTAGSLAALGLAAGLVAAAVATPQRDTTREIAVIVKTSNSNYWQNVHKGARAAIGSAPGYAMSFQGPATESAILDQVYMVENAVTRRAAAIVLAPSDPEALVPAVRKAWAARIPVVIIDSPLAPAGKRYYRSFLSSDNIAAGEASAKALIDRIGTTGKIAIMSYVAGAGSEAARVGGFRRYIETHSKLTIVGTYYSQSLMATALNQTIDVLASNPDLKGMFGANEPTAVGMGRALLQSGRAGSVTGVGFDGNRDLRDFVKNGTLHATTVQNSFAMGSQGLRAAIDIVEGRPVPALINTGVVVVDRKNVDTEQARNVLY